MLPLASVETWITESKGIELEGFQVVSPSVKLNVYVPGINSEKDLKGGRGVATVKDPDIRHSGGQLKVPSNTLNSLPV